MLDDKKRPDRTSLLLSIRLLMTQQERKVNMQEISSQATHMTTDHAWKMQIDQLRLVSYLAQSFNKIT